MANKKYVRWDGIVIEKGENAGNQDFLLFSSTEHKVLRVSYCDQSVIHPPSVRLFTITKKSSSPKLTIRFQSNFTEMIPRSCSFKIRQRIEFREEIWLPWQQSEKL